MFVGKRMTKDVIVVAPGDTLEHAARLLAGHRIHRMPVMEGDRLVGIVTDTDIRNAAFRDAQAGTPPGARTVGEIMTREVITVSPQDTVEDALLILQKKRLGALPVIDGGRLVGIITKADVLAALIETLDIEGIGSRIEVILPGDVGSVLGLIERIGKMGIEIRSLVLAPHRDRFAAFLRLATIDVAKAKAALREAGFTVAELTDFLG
ncbi:MAG: CBS and ACT domain-containing protein [Deltaproteobacteria bacterium]|nr:CBS and ACT domain-containing protein [Deltaproteobacteria bacterium]